jgi:hypothetical protein
MAVHAATEEAEPPVNRRLGCWRYLGGQPVIAMSSITA